jgi:hypothetical protein
MLTCVTNQFLFLLEESPTGKPKEMSGSRNRYVCAMSSDARVFNLMWENWYVGALLKSKNAAL